MAALKANVKNCLLLELALNFKLIVICVKITLETVEKSPKIIKRAHLLAFVGDNVKAYNLRFSAFLNLAPNLLNTNGNGIMTTQMNPSNEFPQPKPRDAYMGGPDNGRKAPTILRSMTFAAIAEAAYIG